ncbi:MAG: RNA polymerase sigma factor, partial [Planctomycetota bacterium]
MDFHELVDQHYDRLFRAARFMCSDLAAAEDLVQETFLAAAESLKKFEGRS